MKPDPIRTRSKSRYALVWGRIVLALALTALSIAVQADAVDDYVRSEMQRQHIPGLSLAVVKDGKVIKAAGYGIAVQEPNVVATPTTVYRIGSLSKQFIASAVMLLKADGKLRLEDTIDVYLKDAPAAWKPITIHQLLTHTSGLVREAPAFNARKLQPDIDVIHSAYDLPLVFAPGSKWQYSNVGYFILAEIIHRVTGKAWGDYMAERIFRPVGMAATDVTTTHAPVKNRAEGYAWQTDHWAKAPPITTLRPSGAFLSTVLDLAKWDAALYGDSVLKAADREQMWQPVRLTDGSTHGYGYGWGVGKSGGHALISHGGAGWGFISQFDRFVDDRLSVIILTNIDAADTGAIAARVAKFYF